MEGKCIIGMEEVRGLFEGRFQRGLEENKI